MSRNTVVSMYCVLIIIRKLKFQGKENYFQTHAAGFARLPYLVDKGKKEVGLFFNMGKVLLKCS